MAGIALSPYLLELFNVNIKLIAKLGFGLREGQNLGIQSSRSSSFRFHRLSLSFIFGHVILNFKLLRT